MLFDGYRRLSRGDRAIKNVELIVYHFFVASVTLLVMGIFGAINREPLASLAMFFGGANLVAGVAILLTHRAMLKGANRQAYLRTMTAVLGSGEFPLLPILLSVVVVLSLALAFVYIFLL
jgi:hypothetical protein